MRFAVQAPTILGTISAPFCTISRAFTRRFHSLSTTYDHELHHWCKSSVSSTVHFGPWTLDFGPWTSDFGPWTSDFGPWTSDFGPWTSDFGLWTLDFALWTLDFGPWTLDFRLRTLDLGLWTLDFGSGPHESNPVEPNRTHKFNLVHQKSGQIGKETVNFSKPT